MVLGAHDTATEFTGDLHAAATRTGAEFAAPLPRLIAATEPGDVQRWVPHDRKPGDRRIPDRLAGDQIAVAEADHPGRYRDYVDKDLSPPSARSASKKSPTTTSPAS